MRTSTPPLLPIFRSRLQGDLLALLLVEPNATWTIDQLAARTNEPYQTIATEIRRLEKSELLTTSTVGRTKVLQANTSNPYIPALTQLVTMAFGPPLVLKEELAQVPGINHAFIYGSWADRYLGNDGQSPNDVDVLIIGEADRDDVYAAARRAQARLGREVNVVQRTSSQWDEAADGFTQRVKSAPMIEVC